MVHVVLPEHSAVEMKIILIFCAALFNYLVQYIFLWKKKKFNWFSFLREDFNFLWDEWVGLWDSSPVEIEIYGPRNPLAAANKSCFHLNEKICPTKNTRKLGQKQKPTKYWKIWPSGKSTLCNAPLRRGFMKSTSGWPLLHEFFFKQVQLCNFLCTMREFQTLFERYGDLSNNHALPLKCWFFFFLMPFNLKV